MKMYTILCTATYVACYEVYYPEDEELDTVPVTETHAVSVRVYAETYWEAVERIETEGIIDTLFEVTDLGAIEGTRNIAPYAEEVSMGMSIKQVEEHLDYIDPLEDFTLQDTQKVVPVVRKILKEKDEGEDLSWQRN